MNAEAETERFRVALEAINEFYRNWRTDRARNMRGLPAQHAYFTGPTRRKHYSRRERRRRWP